MARQAIGLEEDHSQKVVTEAVEVAAQVICRLWKRFEETGNVRRLSQYRKALTIS